MDVAQGTIHALIGPNGAGKSTVFNCVSRFYRPSEGDILFEGQSLLRRAGARHRGARHRAHLPEHRAVPPPDRAGERADRHGAARARLFSVRARPRKRTGGGARRASPRPTRCWSAPASCAIATRRPSSSISGARRCSILRARSPRSRSCCCSTSRPPACATARSRRSTRCWSISRARRASPSCWSST